MATLAESKRVVYPSEQRIVLRGIDWATYEALAAQTSSQPIRLAYDRGILELMCPGPLHERLKILLSRLVDEVLIGLRLPHEAVGEARWKKDVAERGLEADACYYLSAEKIAVVRGRAPDRPDDPFPDLAIEIDIEHADFDKVAIYAELGVSEVWRFDGTKCVIHQLQPDGTYEERPQSLILKLRPEDIIRWVDESRQHDMMEWSEAVRAWVRDELAQRR